MRDEIKRLDMLNKAIDLVERTKRAIYDTNIESEDKMDILTRHEHLSICLDELYHFYISTDNERIKTILKPMIEAVSSLEQKYGEKL